MAGLHWEGAASCPPIKNVPTTNLKHLTLNINLGRARCHALPVQTCMWVADGRFYELLAEEEVEVALGGGLDP